MRQQPVPSEENVKDQDGSHDQDLSEDIEDESNEPSTTIPYSNRSFTAIESNAPEPLLELWPGMKNLQDCMKKIVAVNKTKLQTGSHVLIKKVFRRK